MWPFRSRPRFRRLSPGFAVAGQLRPEDLPAAAAEGFRLLVCARPDGESPGQPSFAALATEASRHGLTARHIPVRGAPTPAQAAELRRLLAQGPVLCWCRSGARAQALWHLAQRQPGA